MKRHLVALSLLSLLACSAPTSRSTEPFVPVDPVEISDLEGRLARLTESLEEQRQAQHIAGMAMAIVKDDELIYAKGFGQADRERDLPVTPETQFAIGSTTKAFTSTIIGMLMDEGAMDWDDPITDHLEYFELPIDESENEGEVLIRDLLAHRTGFTRMGVLWAANATDRRTILETATTAEPWSPFRDAFFYNNVMYLAAGEAAASAAGKSWEELVADWILAPLGMNDSTLSVAEAQKDERLALGYLWDDEQEEYEELPMRPLDAIAPAGSINSNVLDMAQWLRLLLARGTFEGTSIVSAERIEETWTAQIPLGGGSSYGLGWMLHDWNGQRVVEHGGNIDGFSASVALLPDSGIGMVLLMNASSAGLQQSGRQMVWDALLGQEDSEEVAADAKPAEESFDDYLGRYVANYATFENEVFEVRIQNDRLAIDIPSQMTYELLEPGEDGKRGFAMAPGAIQADFERNEAGEVVLLKLYQSGLEFEVPREGVSFPADGAQEDFAAFYGTYSHPLLPEPFTVLYRNGRLACDVPGQMVFELRLPNENGVRLFRVSDELGLEFHADESGEVASVTFHERGTETLCQRIGTGATELPSIEDVLALRKAQETGARIDELGTLRFSGSVRMVHSGVRGTSTTTFAGHDLFLNESSLHPFGWTCIGFDGETAWSDSAFQEYDEPEGKLRTQLVLAHPAVFFGDWRKHFDTLEVVRASQQKGRPHWVVRLKKDELPAWMAHVDAETGDLTRVDSKILIPSGTTLPQTTYLEDHRDAHGVRLPHRVVTETVANGRVVVEYEEIEAGFELPEGFFAPRKGEPQGN